MAALSGVFTASGPSLSNSATPVNETGLHKRLGGNTTKQMTPTTQEENPCHIMISLAINNNKTEKYQETASKHVKLQQRFPKDWKLVCLLMMPGACSVCLRHRASLNSYATQIWINRNCWGKCKLRNGDTKGNFIWKSCVIGLFPFLCSFTVLQPVDFFYLMELVYLFPSTASVCFNFNN